MHGVKSQATVRASDAERERAVQILRDHCVQGRLAIEEFDDRVTRAVAATMRSELEALALDLPTPTSPSAAHNAKLWWPGSAAFHVERWLGAHIETVYEDALRVIVPRMAMAGFTLRRERAPRLLDFVRKAFATLRD